MVANGLCVVDVFFFSLISLLRLPKSNLVGVGGCSLVGGGRETEVSVERLGVDNTVGVRSCGGSPSGNSERSDVLESIEELMLRLF